MNVTCPDWHESQSGPCLSYIKGGHCKSPMYFRCVEYLKQEVKLSYSSIKDFSQCRRKFFYSYVMGLEYTEKPLPILLGSIADSILQQLHSSTSLVRGWTYDFGPHRDKDGNLPYQMEALVGLFNHYQYPHIKGDVQYEFTWMEDGFPKIHGYLDLMGGSRDWGYEFKFTSSPDAYNKFTISDQLGTYFLGCSGLEKMTLRAIRTPMLRPGKDEPLSAYRERVEDDFKKRPKFYINDKSYYRNEFDLDSVKARAKKIAEDIRRYLDHVDAINEFFQTIGPSTCFMPGPCWYEPICSSGVISPILYTKRGVKS